MLFLEGDYLKDRMKPTPDQKYILEKREYFLGESSNIKQEIEVHETEKSQIEARKKAFLASINGDNKKQTSNSSTEAEIKKISEKFRSILEKEGIIKEYNDSISAISIYFETHNDIVLESYQMDKKTRKVFKIETNKFYYSIKNHFKFLSSDYLSVSDLETKFNELNDLFEKYTSFTFKIVSDKKLKEQINKILQKQESLLKIFGDSKSDIYEFYSHQETILKIMDKIISFIERDLTNAFGSQIIIEEKDEF